MSNTKCPGCSGELVPLYADAPLSKCQHCGGLVSLEVLSWGLACLYVGLNKPMSKCPDMTNARYFDLDLRRRGSLEVVRVHGWYDVVDVDHKVLQYG